LNFCQNCGTSFAAAFSLSHKSVSLDGEEEGLFLFYPSAFVRLFSPRHLKNGGNPNLIMVLEGWEKSDAE
jgi:hypothetical protein